MNPIYLQALSFQDRFGPGEDCIHAAADMAAELDIAGIDIEDRLLKSFEPGYLQELAHQIEGRGVNFGYCGLIVDFRAPVSSIEDEIDRATRRSNRPSRPCGTSFSRSAITRTGRE